MQTVTAAFAQHLHHLTDHNQNMQRLSFRNTNNIKKSQQQFQIPEGNELRPKASLTENIWSCKVRVC